MTSDDLRAWADYLDYPGRPRPDGVDPQTAPDLLKAVASLLRVTADPDPLHPTWKDARDKAAAVYQRATSYPHLPHLAE